MEEHYPKLIFLDSVLNLSFSYGKLLFSKLIFLNSVLSLSSSYGKLLVSTHSPACSAPVKDPNFAALVPILLVNIKCVARSRFKR